MKNKYLGFQIGFASMFIWTVYDDQKKLILISSLY